VALHDELAVALGIESSELCGDEAEHDEMRSYNEDLGYEEWVCGECLDRVAEIVEERLASGLPSEHELTIHHVALRRVWADRWGEPPEMPLEADQMLMFLREWNGTFADGVDAFRLLKAK
jgi:hypothetical protein